MPSWNEILDESRSASQYDLIRRRHLAECHRITGRNVIAYYSGWLQKGDIPGGVAINDEDKNGLMTVIHGLDRNLGLDLILHTPGGDTAATESIVDYLRSMFGTNMRAVVPQLAMSGGTMIACACTEIVMGKQSSLGPIDPQLAGIPAHGVVEEFNRAKQEVSEDSTTIPIWQAILAKYMPTLIGECEKAIAWSNEMTVEWLQSGMFRDDEGASATIQRIIAELGDHALTKSHARHLSAEHCREIGLRITELENDQEFQDAVLSVHHACMVSFSSIPAVKIIENHAGVAFIKSVQSVLMPSPTMPNQEIPQPLLGPDDA